MLPNHYFTNVAQNVARLLEELDFTYEIELHTEVASREFLVQPDHHGIFNRISSPAVISPSMSQLDDFSVLPNLVRCINERTIDCLAKLATADVLIMELVIVQLCWSNSEQERHHLVPSVLACCAILMDNR